MLIGPLDGPTWCDQSVVADLPPFGLGYVGIGMYSFGSPPMYSHKLPIDTYGLSVTVFELIFELSSWLQKRFRPSVCPSDPDTMTSTALEATDSSSCKNYWSNANVVYLSNYQFYFRPPLCHSTYPTRTWIMWRECRSSSYRFFLHSSLPIEGQLVQIVWKTFQRAESKFSLVSTPTGHPNSDLGGGA